MDPSTIGLTEQDIEAVVKSYIKDKRNRVNGKFRLVSYQVRRLSEDPIGYLGDHYLLDVNLREKMVHYTPEEEEQYAEEEYISFFLKVLPETVPKLADYIKEMGCFRKEILLYKHLIPRLQDVMIGTRQFVPTAYYTKDERMVVFENLRTDGYSIVEGTTNLLDLEHLKVALQAVAKLHASSLILEERSGAPIPKLFVGYLNENAYVEDEDHVRKVNLDNAIRVMCEMIKRIDCYAGSDRLDEILRKVPDVVRKIYDFSKPSTVYRNVLNHGDLWSNNVMFRYELIPTSGDNGKDGHLTEVGGGDGSSRVRDARLVDFQLARYAPPVLDVWTLLMLCTVRDFRRTHARSLLDWYYESLKELLTSAGGLEIERVVPRAQFDASCADFELAGLIESLLFSHLTLIPKRFAKDMLQCSEAFDSFLRGNGKERVCLESFETDTTYRERLSEMLTELIESYCLVD
ncbi:Juvenile hormone-inducible protein [Anopheles darlingi]|uniref:Juvenile hormone-inducible protein n=1 Tax=Anopheles darlingi TaxID=43151 RepID=W5JH78_ANODA|nr:Juvenile hormone-inducible protein [Anopheles darlingi]